MPTGWRNSFAQIALIQSLRRQVRADWPGLATGKGENRFCDLADVAGLQLGRLHTRYHNSFSGRITFRKLSSSPRLLITNSRQFWIENSALRTLTLALTTVVVFSFEAGVVCEGETRPPETASGKKNNFAEVHRSNHFFDDVPLKSMMRISSGNK